MTKKKLRLYNTATGKKELFKPLKGKAINVFVCGPTVDGFPHIGHARTYVIFDCFVKYLKFMGFDVFYLQNITDVDDKIIAKAREKGVGVKDLAAAFEKEHLTEMEKLGITSVKKYARATDYIPQIISQVERLIKKGYAYKLEDGMYFDIRKFKKYGRLSHRTALQAEDSVSRIDYSTDKKNRGDFCLWKFNRPENKEPSWPSPFGNGRPGWHIEDTAITETFFGPKYDIHGGGRDLIFPHHEAEIAQMEAISGRRPMARYWMHVGFLTINDQKMSKSLNNGITINDFLKRYSAEQLRFWIAKNLWRSPMNYSEDTMIEVREALEKIEEFLRKVKAQKSNIKMTLKNAKLLKDSRTKFYKNLDDDFNTPKAFAVVFEMIRAINPLLDQHTVGKKYAEKIAEFFDEINSIFRIIDSKKLKQTTVPAEVQALLTSRQAAREAANWAVADEIRKEIEKYGYAVEDTQEGALLKKIENH